MEGPQTGVCGTGHRPHDGPCLRWVLQRAVGAGGECGDATLDPVTESPPSPALPGRLLVPHLHGDGL